MNFVGLIVFARLLGVDVIGQYGMIIIAIELMSLLFNFGFNQAAIKYSENQNVFSAALSLIIIQSSVLALMVVIVYFSSSLVLESSNGIIFPAVMLLCARILDYFTTLAYAPLESQLKYDAIAKTRVVSVITGISVGLFSSLWLNQSVYVLILRDLVTAVLMFSLMMPKCSLQFRPSFNISELRKVWYFTRPIWYLNLLERGALRSDYALAAFALGQPNIGIYFQVRALVEGVLGFLVNPIQTVIYAFYCKHKNRMVLFQKIMKRALIPVVLLASILFLSFSMTSTGGQMIAFLLGADWQAGGAMLAGMSLYFCAIVVFEHTKVIAIAERKKKMAIIGRFAQIILLALLVIPLASVYGVGGAAIASAAGATLLAIISTLLLLRSEPKKG